jgi:hypothetical protein
MESKIIEVDNVKSGMFSSNGRIYYAGKGVDFKSVVEKRKLGPVSINAVLDKDTSKNTVNSYCIVGEVAEEPEPEVKKRKRKTKTEGEVKTESEVKTENKTETESKTETVSENKTTLQTVTGTIKEISKSIIQLEERPMIYGIHEGVKIDAVKGDKVSLEINPKNQCVGWTVTSDSKVPSGIKAPEVETSVEVKAPVISGKVSYISEDKKTIKLMTSNRRFTSDSELNLRINDDLSELKLDDCDKIIGFTLTPKVKLDAPVEVKPDAPVSCKESEEIPSGPAPEVPVEEVTTKEQDEKKLEIQTPACVDGKEVTPETVDGIKKLDEMKKDLIEELNVTEVYGVVSRIAGSRVGLQLDNKPNWYNTIPGTTYDKTIHVGVRVKLLLNKDGKVVDAVPSGLPENKPSKSIECKVNPAGKPVDNQSKPAGEPVECRVKPAQDVVNEQIKVVDLTAKENEILCRLSGNLDCYRKAVEEVVGCRLCSYNEFKSVITLKIFVSTKMQFQKLSFDEALTLGKLRYRKCYDKVKGNGVPVAFADVVSLVNDLFIELNHELIKFEKKNGK